LLDSLRLLRARALFWVTLGISAFAAILYLSIGFSDTGVTVMFGATEIESEYLRKGSEFAELFYLGLFSKFITGLWLSWIAVILALISCAPIFPDFMAEGSAGIALSKPIGRLRLFLYKYVGSLLFVVVQVGVFALIVIVAIRWRVGVWNPSILWVVPLVLLVFSYLYCVVVLVAVRTKSVLAAVLAAMLVWFAAWLGQKSEEVLYTFAYLEPPPGLEEVSKDNLERLKGKMQGWHRMSLWALAPLPKPTETMNFMDRLVVVGGKQGFSNSAFTAFLLGFEPREDEQVDKAYTRHSAGYVLGTSLGFNFLVLALAAWIFCRKDF
jgi:ABC-type transport system involved in multi-copper enzyme maturation permease subunit